MNILSLDTATDVISIALKTDNSYEERLIKGNFSASEDLLSEIIFLLERASISIKDLDLLIATKGPGSFTGLRVAIASLKGIRAANGAKMVTIPTLLAMANTLKGISPFPIMSVIDAKKKRFYYAIYSSDIEELIEARDASPEAIIESLKGYDKILITGNDAASFLSKIDEEERKRFVLDPEGPRNISKSLIELGIKELNENGEDDIGDGPMYIRRSDAEEALLKKKEEKNA